LLREKDAIYKYGLINRILTGSSITPLRPIRQQPAAQEFRHAPGLGKTASRDEGWLRLGHFTDRTETGG
jgi:hypothetical protein